MFIWQEFYDINTVNPQAYCNLIYWLAELAIDRYNIKNGAHCLNLIKNQEYSKHANPVMDNLLYAAVRTVTTAANQIVKDFDLENFIRYKMLCLCGEINDTKLGRTLYA